MSAPLPVPDEDTIWSLDALAALFQSPSLFGSHELPTIPDHTIHHDAQFNVFTEQAMLNTGCEMFMPLPESRAATVYDVSSNQILHACRRLPNTDNETLDSWLIACDDSEPKSYKCAWADCLAEPFEGRHKARIHIRKHLGINKLYECVVCHKQFVSHGTAKRHTNTQRKAFACKICHNEFARKDYWRVHERRCAQRHLVEPLQAGFDFESSNATT
ncbi:hypothetical protein JB92DRAFT_2085004 [Gautieria morchelliformis]|nr:hypothetical protein JB92DRAFT_2085004 [Gautieria morchelliformis]